MLATCLDCLFSVCLLLQGAQALSPFADHYRDPELSRLASCLPLRCLGARADSTTERYSRAYTEINALPSDCLSVATYFESLIQSNSSFFGYRAAVYGIRWARNLYGFSNPCDPRTVDVV